MKNSDTFRQNFKKLTGETDCTKSEIPKLLGISYDAFKKISDYGWIPSVKTLVRIADALDVSLEFLLGRTEDRDFARSEFPCGFHTRYAALKEEAGFTDYEVAKKLRISTSYTTNWKTHGSVPSLDNLTILSEIFHVSLDYLLGRTDERR